MDREIGLKLIADLRSNPPQAKRVLFDGEGYCCLGRLCVLAGLTPHSQAGGYAFDGNMNTLPPSVMRWAGMKSLNGDYKLGMRPLSAENDRGKTFTEIADIIEAHMEEL